MHLSHRHCQNIGQVGIRKFGPSELILGVCWQLNTRYLHRNWYKKDAESILNTPALSFSWYLTGTCAPIVLPVVNVRIAQTDVVLVK